MGSPCKGMSNDDIVEVRSDVAPAPAQFSSAVSAVGRRSQKKRRVTSSVYEYFVSDPATARVRCMVEGC
jgi:hypothetical protein